MTFRSNLVKMPVKRIANVMFQICLGLDYTHKKGLIHKDISPDNILIAQDETIKLCDFGGASLGSSTINIAGKKSYLAPEIRKE